MKNKLAFIIITINAFCVLAEETNLLSQIEAMDTYKIIEYSDWRITRLIAYAEVAGVGRFISQPSETNLFVDVFVDECWAGDVQNETVSIAFYTTNSVPTNIPIVFLAISSLAYATNMVFSERYTPEQLESIKSNSVLFFPGAESAWFRTTRDNGLLYEFTTNIWNCRRMDNYNRTNYYEVLRNASNITFEESNRIWWDSDNALNWLFLSSPTEFMVEKRLDPLLHERVKDILNTYIWNRGWTHTNGVWYAPPPE